MMRELGRVALHVYKRERRAWQDVFAYGEKNAKELGIRDEQDVVRIVREARSARRGSEPGEGKRERSSLPYGRGSGSGASEK